MKSGLVCYNFYQKTPCAVEAKEYGNKSISHKLLQACVSADQDTQLYQASVTAHPVGVTNLPRSKAKENHSLSQYIIHSKLKAHWGLRASRKMQPSCFGCLNQDSKINNLQITNFILTHLGFFSFSF